jgi:hypothetical protein
MTQDDKHMLTARDLQHVSWEHFMACIEGRGEMMVAVVEQKRHKEGTVAPGPDNDVIVAAVLVVWTDTLITTVEGLANCA